MTSCELVRRSGQSANIFCLRVRALAGTRCSQSRQGGSIVGLLLAPEAEQLRTVPLCPNGGSVSSSLLQMLVSTQMAGSLAASDPNGGELRVCLSPLILRLEWPATCFRSEIACCRLRGDRQKWSRGTANCTVPGHPGADLTRAPLEEHVSN